MQNFQGTVLYEYKHLGRFSNLHWCTFNIENIFTVELKGTNRVKKASKPENVNKKIYRKVYGYV